MGMVLLLCVLPALASQSPRCASPTALAASRDGRSLYIACAESEEVAVFDTVARKVVCEVQMPGPPLGLVLTKHGSRLYVTCDCPVQSQSCRNETVCVREPNPPRAPSRPRPRSVSVPGKLLDIPFPPYSSTVCVVDTASRRIVQTLEAGHTPMSPVLSPNEKTLFICNRFDDEVQVVDLTGCDSPKRVKVERQPVAAALTPDGKYLLVANHLHAGQASLLHVGATVSVIDTRTLSVTANIRLPLGAGLLNGLAISPDGRFAAVTHLRSAYWLSTTSVELGRMNCAALTVLDLERLDTLGVILLDRTGLGAANPWAVTWTLDGNSIVVAHAGTHELSFIDAPVIADPASFASTSIGAYTPTEMGPVRMPRQKPVRVRRYVTLPGCGPRAMTIAGSCLYVANYFSDDLCRIDLDNPDAKAERLKLGPDREPSLVRQGEMLFNDATLCRQHWQSCASCHDSDARTDALNWDLLNDGVNNPKKTKSLVWAHQTGPAMALGVRTNAATAVRAGMHHILFADAPEEAAEAIDAYLKSLQPLPSPRLVDGRLSPAAERGKRIFASPATGCGSCHPGPLFTDMAPHDVGTANEFHSLYFSKAADKPTDRFYTPALVELWRTAPYLHDGSAVSLREVLVEKNKRDLHGRTSHLSAGELDDLVEYLLTL